MIRAIWGSLVAMGISLGSLSAVCLVGALAFGLIGGAGARAIGPPLVFICYFALPVMVFALVGWVISILPLTVFRPSRLWLAHPRLGELVWAVQAVVSFGVLLGVGSRGRAMLFAWVPTIIGIVAGHAYRRLMRSAENTP